MKRLNPKTGKPFKNGTLREDGYVFAYYQKSIKKQDGTYQEIWLNKESWEKRKENSAKSSYKWRTKNPEKMKQSRDNWKKYNYHVLIAHNGKRRAQKMLRTPNWLTADDLFIIEEAYHVAKLRTELTGIQYHVDHILPLQGKKVSGLHVPGNIQVIPAKINLQKSNKHE